MSENLLPCPFCGGSDIESLVNLDWVCCHDCGATLEDVEPSARELWNTRAQPQSPSEDDRIDDAKRITSAILKTIGSGGDNLAIYEAVYAAVSRPDRGGKA